MSSPGSVAHFGDFMFDPSSGELHGPAGTSRLPPRVAGLLALLIGNAGSVVTRSDLQAALWPTTTVEFDDGLNACVRQLRIALNDDASTPRYIETLPRRGYRFIAAVTTEADAGTERDTDGSATVGRHSSRTLLATCVIAGIVLVIGLAAWLAARPHSQGTSPIVVAFAPFDADTMDPPLARYRERVDSTILRITRGATVPHLRLVGVDIARPIERTAGTARTVQLSGATHLLLGSMARRGAGTRLLVELVRLPDWHHVWADSVVDTYAFSGNATIVANRIVDAVAHTLDVSANPR